MLVPVFFVLFAASAESQCTNVKPVENLDLEKLLGVWYENARYPTDWEGQGECTIAKYEREGDAIRFYWSQVYENNHKLGNATGLMEHANNDKSGVIRFTSPLFEEATASNVLITNVVDVDYDHYILYFQCKYDPINNVDVDHAWIFTKSTTLEPQARAKLEEFFAKNNLDINVLIWDKFGDKDCQFLN